MVCFSGRLLPSRRPGSAVDARGWGGRGACDKNPRPRTGRGLRAQHPAQHDSGGFSGFESPCSSARRAPPGKSPALIRPPRRLCVLLCATRACPPTPRRRLRALESPARSSPPIRVSNDSPPHPPCPSRGPRSVSGAWACVAVRCVVIGRQGSGSARWCVLAGAVCHRGRRNVRRSTDADVGLCSAHGTTPARPLLGRLGVVSGGAFRSFGVCIAATGHPRVCLPRAARERGRRQRRHLRCSPEPPDQQCVVTSRFKYNPQRTHGGGSITWW